MTGWADEGCRVGGVAFDRARGAGNVPDGADIGHTGATVLMRPTAYLTLAARLRSPKAGTLSWLAAGIREGLAVAPSFLSVEWPVRDGTPARVSGHDGRHRMMAVRAATGDAPVPVHVFVRGRRASFLDAGRVAFLRSRIADEEGLFSLAGPVFGAACVAGLVHDAPDPPARNPSERFVPFEPRPCTEAFLARAVEEGGHWLDVDGAMAALRALDVFGLEEFTEWPGGRLPDRNDILRDLHGIRAGHGGDASLAVLLGLPGGCVPRA